MIKPQITQTTSRNYALFRLGFRPFFLFAAMFSCVSTLLWMWLYLNDMPTRSTALAPQIWHAHEMIFGYALGVIAGFLLTAVRNWTGIQTLQGTMLAALVLAWLSARIMILFMPDQALALAMLLDSAFGIFLAASLSIPVIQSRKWKQTGILIIVSLIVGANMMFYAGAISGSSEVARWGTYLGLYLVVGLVMVIGGRVIPAFVERGVGYDVKLTRWGWVDKANIIAFILFVTTDVFVPGSAAFYFSAALCLLNTLRLWGWYTQGIWKKPLLWVLYLAYAFVVVGFALKSLSFWIPVLPYLTVHAFAYGGIGMMTLGMMARVSLGHTGRDVYDPPAPLFWIFTALLFGAIVRVLMPVIDMAHYPWWVALSQIAWITAFGIFVYVYFPILIKPRIDGRDG